MITTTKCMVSPPGVSVFKHGEGGFPCIRAPSIVSTNSGVLVAFAMCRLYTGDGCKLTTQTYDTDNLNISDPPYAYACSKRSTDGGKTWSNLSFPFGKDYYSRIGASVYDSFNNQILFQSNVYDQSSNESIYQLISTNDGLTWNNPPLDIGRLYLGDVGKNHLIGPGNGLQLKNGRILFVAHYEKQDTSNDTADRVWFSDDYGKTYKLSQTMINNMNEATMVQLNNGSVIINARNKIFVNSSCNGEAHCRGVVISNDNGTTFGDPYPVPQLIGPVCEGSLISTNDGRIYFSNPNSTSSRVNMTVKMSMDDGNTWNNGYLVYDGQTAYSCLTRMKGIMSNDIGLLFETEAENCDGPSCQIRFTTIPPTF